MRRATVRAARLTWALFAASTALAVVALQAALTVTDRHFDGGLGLGALAFLPSLALTTATVVLCAALLGLVPSARRAWRRWALVAAPLVVAAALGTATAWANIAT